MSGCKGLSEAETNLLLSFVRNKRDRALIILGIKSGFRISELLSLEVKDVLQYDAIVDRVTVNKRNTKGKVASRSVPLHREAKEAITNLLREGLDNSNKSLFQSREGGPLSACQAWRIITRAAKAAKLSGKVATHSLRKSFAQHVYNLSDRDIAATQRAMGHKSVNSTIAYLNVDQTVIDDIILK